MAEYQKVLQLYRSTNIWETKNIAKAEIEIHAKDLHVELLAQLKDGEPIVGKYWDNATDPVYKYTYTYTHLDGNPYDTTAKSADHVWVDDFDSFTPNEFNYNSGNSKIKGKELDYNSPAYLRVDNGDSTYVYYKLNVNITGIPNPDIRTISAVFGVVITGNNKLYIEWFDSAAEAQGAISELNYSDNELANGFVALVNQKDGKVEAIHGTISGKDAININQNTYTYVKLSQAEAEAIPSDYVWVDGENEGTTKPSDPQSVSNATPKYYHVTTGNDAGYYELRKNINVDLVINDANNILSQGIHWVALSSDPYAETPESWTSSNTFETKPDAVTTEQTYIRVGTSTYNYYQRDADHAGLSTNMNLRQLTADEIGNLQDSSNVKEAYKLVGLTGDREHQIGTTIKIYKDSSLYQVYLGHVDDTLTSASDPTVIPGTGADALCFIYIRANGKYELVAVPVESFLSENEFRDGFELKGANPHYTDSEAPADPSTYTWTTNVSEFTTRAAAIGTNGVYPNGVASASDPLYIRYGSGSNWHYLRKESGKEVYVKLANDGGIDFKDEGEGVNKSLKIKIDETEANKYYRLIASGETVAEADRYAYVGVSVEHPDGYAQDNDGAYVKDIYLHTSTDGLRVDENVIDNTIADKVTKTLKINTEGVVKDSNGNLIVTLVGEDIKVAGEGSTNANVEMTTITTIDDVVPVYYATAPTAAIGTPNYILVTESNVKVIKKKVENSGTYSYVYYTVTNNPEYIEVNGLIYQFKTDHYELFYINKDTNLNDAVAILNYLTYNLDMGQFTI